MRYDMNNLVLATCKHGYSNGQPSKCPACLGSGYVSVIPSEDGKARECLHGYSNGDVSKCPACMGSGWAGIIDINKLYQQE